jgi:hypothetical protein
MHFILLHPVFIYLLSIKFRNQLFSNFFKWNFVLSEIPSGLFVRNNLPVNFSEYISRNYFIDISTGLTNSDR